MCRVVGFCFSCSLTLSTGQRVQNPAAFMWMMKDTQFSELVRRTHLQKPSSEDAKWRMIVYSDEVPSGVGRQNQFTPT